MALWESQLKNLLGDHARIEAVYRPAPAEGLVRCYVRRVKVGQL